MVASPKVMSNQEIKVTVLRGIFVGLILIALIALGQCSNNEPTGKMTLEDKAYKRIRDRQEQRNTRIEELERRYNSRDYR